MKKLVFSMVGVCVICASATQCNTDSQVARINASVQKYCTQLQTASEIAADLANKPLVDKINRGLQVYCSGPVTDVSSALIALAAIYREVNKAGIPTTAAN
jgi:uncharacterized membrane protein